MRSSHIFLRTLLAIGLTFGAGVLYVHASSTGPAVITEAHAVNITGSEAQITWTTDDLSDSQVYYGTTTANFVYTATSRCDLGGMVTSHCVKLTGLSASMKYYYNVRSMNQFGFTAEQMGYFMSAPGTSGTGGTIPVAPSSLRLSSTLMSSGISLLWNDNSTNEDKFNVERKLSAESTYSGAFLAQIGANLTSYIDTTAVAGTNYDYRVQACLSSYGCSTYVYLTGVSATPLVDTTSPTAPSLSGAPYLSTQVNLYFSGATDNVGVVGYKIFRNGTPFTTVTTTLYSDTGLTPGTSYSYYVRALDAAGNDSAPSVTVNVLTGSDTATTLPVSTDATPPSAPSSVSATPFSSNRVDIVWSGATDNVGVVGYKIWRNNVEIAGVTGTSYSDTGVGAGTTNTYAIKAVDAAGYSSAPSMNTYATTPITMTSSTTTTTVTGDITAPILTSVRAMNITSQDAMVTWMTDDPSDSRVAYGTVSSVSGAYSNIATSRCDAGALVVSHCVKLTSLSAGTHYYYRVFSRNAPGLHAMSAENSFVTLFGGVSTTTTTTTTTASTTMTTSVTPSSILVGVTVEKGITYCDGTTAKTPINFIATPLLGASFYLTTETGSRRGDTPPGKYLLLNGTYYWKAIPHAGYTLSSGTGASFVLNKTCVSSPIVTTGAAPSLVEPPLQPTPLKTTPDVTPPVLVKPLESGVKVSPRSATSSLSPIFTLFTQSPGVTTVATLEQSTHYCDDPVNQKECAQYVSQHIIASSTPHPIIPAVTAEVFARVQSQGALPGGATNPKELTAVCAQSTYASSCAELFVEAQILSTEEAKNNRDQLISVRKEEAQVLVDRVGARVFQDTDNDGITDYDEINIYHTDPRQRDSNKDGVSDGEHLMLSTDPLFVFASSSESTSPLEVATTTRLIGVVDVKRVIYENPKFSGETKSQLLTVTNVTAVPASIGAGGTTSIKLLLSGLALPNSFVTLFIFSDPIVVTVKTDESGAWTYILDKELPDGSHEVTSAITDGGGRILAKSSPLPFVKEAAAVSIGAPLFIVQPEVPSFFSGSSLYVLVATVIVVFGLALVIIGFIVKRRPGEQISVPTNTEKNNFFP